MENGKHAYYSMPLVSRLEHLELIMKDLESKKNLGKWGSSVHAEERQYLPLNMAVRETYLKGSLLDRIASLENRLLQLCLEMESSSTSSTSSGTSGDSSSSQQGSKKEMTCSLPTFSNNPCQVHKQEPHVQVNRSEMQEKYSKVVVQRRRRLPSPNKDKGKNKANRDEKTCKSGKKRVSPNPKSNWPHLKILGC